jgi:hypothetical protein
MRRAARLLLALLVGLAVGGCDVATDSPPTTSAPTTSAPVVEGAYDDSLRDRGRELTEEWQRQQCRDAQAQGDIPPDFPC